MRCGSRVIHVRNVPMQLHQALSYGNLGTYDSYDDHHGRSSTMSYGEISSGEISGGAAYAVAIAGAGWSP